MEDESARSQTAPNHGRHGGDPLGRSAGGAGGSRLARMLARKPRELVAVALANKMARIVWALMTTKETYRDPVTAFA